MKKEIEVSESCYFCGQELNDSITRGYKCFKCKHFFCAECLSTCSKCGGLFCVVDCLLEHMEDEGFIKDTSESGEIVTIKGTKKKKIILVCDFCEDEIEEGKVGTMCSKCGVTACESCAVDFIEHIISEGFIKRITGRTSIL